MVDSYDTFDFENTEEVPKKDNGVKDVDKERLSLREQLKKDIENFLAAGGQVQKIEKDLRADPPKRPTMNYGSAPI